MPRNNASHAYRSAPRSMLTPLRAVFAAVAAMALLLLTVIAAVPASAAILAGSTGDGTRANPFVLDPAQPVNEAVTTLVADEDAQAGSQHWNNVKWFSLATTAGQKFEFRVHPTNGWDSRLEVWKDVSPDPDEEVGDYVVYGTDQLLTVAPTADTTYLIGVGGKTVDDVGDATLTAITAVPSVPTDVSATFSDTSATVSWAAPNADAQAVTTYRIKSVADEAEEVVTTVEGTPPATTATVSGLQRGRSYTFAVEAVNAIGASGYSEPTETRLIAAPPVVSSVSADAIAVESARLNGSVVSYGLATEVKFTVSKDAGLSDRVETTQASDSMIQASADEPSNSIERVRLDVNDLKAQTTYYYQITATNSLGTSSSEVKSFTTKKAPKPQKPPATIHKKPGGGSTSSSGGSSSSSSSGSSSYTPSYPDSSASSGSAPAPAPVVPVTPTVQETITTDLQLPVGSPLQGATVVFTGANLQPSSTVRFWVHSEPVSLGEATTDASGVFSTTATIPVALPGGAHELRVEAINTTGAPVSSVLPFGVGMDGNLTGIGQEAATAAQQVADAAAAPAAVDARQQSAEEIVGAALLAKAREATADPSSTYPLYAITSQPVQIVILTVGAFALLSLMCGVVTRSSCEMARRAARQEFKEHSERQLRLYGRPAGDRSKTWQWPGTALVDNLSMTLPGKTTRFSPLLGKIMIDGSYLRAMLGSIYIAVPLLALVLGGAAAVLNGGSPLPPAWPLLVGLMLIGILDAFSGALAALAFSLGVIALGGFHGADSIRIMLAIAVLWFGIPIVAAASRTLRRTPADVPSLEATFDHAGDYVIAAVVGAFAAAEIVGFFPGLSGIDVPIAASAFLVALFAFAGVLCRVGLEAVAAKYYPERLDAVVPEAMPEPDEIQLMASLVFRCVLFVFIAVTFVGFGFPLVIGVVVVRGSASALDLPRVHAELSGTRQIPSNRNRATRVVACHGRGDCRNRCPAL